MVYLKYYLESKIVVEISENDIAEEQGYAIAQSDNFEVGDEFEKTIYINEVDQEGIVASSTSIRNTARMKDVLTENNELRTRLNATEDTILLLMMEGL